MLVVGPGDGVSETTVGPLLSTGPAPRERALGDSRPRGSHGWAECGFDRGSGALTWHGFDDPDVRRILRAIVDELNAALATDDPKSAMMEVRTARGIALEGLGERPPELGGDSTDPS